MRTKGQIKIMSKHKTMMFALLAVFAFSAVATSSAFAAHEWLFEGKPITAAKAVLIDGTIILHKKLTALEGGGEILVTCIGQLHGTVGPGKADSITEVLGSSGEKTKIHCEVTHSTNSFCPVGTLVLVNALKLPWATELVLEGTTVFDNITAAGKGPGYEAECIAKLSCELNDRAKFVENAAAGAVLEFLGELKATCTDGQEGRVLGSGTVLGVTVS
jgi:hypothetical protein